MLFEQPLVSSNPMRSAGLFTSQKGLVSDYNSDAEYRDDALPRTSTPLASESVVIYPKDDLIVYKRTLEINREGQHLVVDVRLEGLPTEIRVTRTAEKISPG